MKRMMVSWIAAAGLSLGLAAAALGAEANLAEETAAEEALTEEAVPAEALTEEAVPAEALTEEAVPAEALAKDELPAEAPEEEPYTEKTVKVLTRIEEAGELPLRFYEETPHVPYIGMREYSAFMYQQPLTIRENEDGTYVLVNWCGEELVCDPGADVITIQNWGRFFDLPLPLENVAKGWKDTSTRFVRITDVQYEGEPETVTLDFAKYGIRVHADENDIYLPVSIMSNMMTDIATNHLLYNGENLYALREEIDGLPVEGFFRSEMLRAQLQGEERYADLVWQCYADLCFTFDYFFGHPGKAVLDEAFAEKGMDQALTDLGEEGAKIKEGLLSPDLKEYLKAMGELFAGYLSDGHTVFTGIFELLVDNPTDTGFLSFDSYLDLIKSPINARQLLNESIQVERRIKWGDKFYREYGNTAIIRLDSFMPDENAWNSFYNGEGDFPEDCLGTVITGLKKAAKNPKIENVIFDLSCNSGGSPDVMMAILAVTTGQTQLYGRHKITGQTMTFTFEADTNFDGVYDEKDKEVKYDFNYGVLCTRHAFSCGNLFPIIVQEAGAVVIGEPSSGGSCCIQVGSDAEGFFYVMSSAQWQLTDSQGRDVEGGCTVNIPIEPKSNWALEKITSLLTADEGMPLFTNYFDDVMLNGMMEGWFRAYAQMDQAA